MVSRERGGVVVSLVVGVAAAREPQAGQGRCVAGEGERPDRALVDVEAHASTTLAAAAA